MRNIIICDTIFAILKNDEDITRSFIIFVIILDSFDFFFDRIALLLSLRIPIRTETSADLKWGNV